MEAETEARPDEAASLHGLLALLQRLDRERVARWVQQRKDSEGRKSLAEEKAQLSERLTLLEQQAEQDRVRIEELQKQIGGGTCMTVTIPTELAHSDEKTHPDH